MDRKVCVGIIAAAIEVDVEGVYRLVVGNNPGERDVPASDGIEFGSVQRYVGIQRAGYGDLLAGEAGEVRDVQVRSIEVDLNGAGIGECPFVEAGTGAEGDAPSRLRLKIGVLQARSGGTGIDAGSKDLPVSSIYVKIGSRELACEMRSGHRSLHGSLECCRTGQVERLSGGRGEETGDRPPSRLLDFYKSYHAAVRAQIALWHLADDNVRDRGRWVAKANRYLEIASGETRRRLA